MRIICVISVAALLTAQDKDPENVLQSMQTSIEDAIKKAPKDADTRGRFIAAAKAKFDQDIKSATPGVTKSIWDFQTQYLEKLVVADKKFSGDILKTERNTWLTCCKSVFVRWLANCREVRLAEDEMPTTEDTYGELLKSLGKAKSRFVGVGVADLRSAGSASARDAFSKLIAKARAPVGDAQKLYEEQLVKIDKTFPTNSEDQKSQNEEVSGILKTAAKSAFDRALKAPK